MASLTHTQLIDDIDGSSAAQETIIFGVNGKHYEIDLSATNAERFHETIHKYVSSARPASKHRKNTTLRTPRDVSTAVRDWARTNGYPVAQRGRLPREIIAAYRAATV